MRDGYLGALEDVPAGVRHYLGTDLHKIELYASKRPVRNLFRQCESAHEVPEVVCRREQGQPHLVGGEPRAG